MSAARFLTLTFLLVTADIAHTTHVAAQDAPAGCHYSTTQREADFGGTAGAGYVSASVYRPERVLVCPSPDSPGATEGGGDGGESQCTTTPFGDTSEVYAIYQAVNAAQTPAPGDTNYTADQ